MAPFPFLMPWGSRSEEPLELKREIEAMGRRCELLEVDLSRPQAYLVVLNAAESMGVPMILVNNACYSVNDGIEAFTVENLDAHYAVNVRATTMLSANGSQGKSCTRMADFENAIRGSSCPNGSCRKRERLCAAMHRAFFA